MRIRNGRIETLKNTSTKEDKVFVGRQDAERMADQINSNSFKHRFWNIRKVDEG
jgi:hypothetical protein